MRSEWRIKGMELELSILRACSLQSKLENKKKKEKKKVDLSNKNYKIENLRKISEQGTLNSLKILGKFIRKVFESINSECQEYLSYAIILLRNSEKND